MLAFNKAYKENVNQRLILKQHICEYKSIFYTI